MTAEPARRVPADAVVVAYAQLVMLQLMARGRPARQASETGWDLFCELARITTGMVPREPARRVAVPVNCLSQSSGGVRDALLMPWGRFAARHRAGYAVLLPADVIARLAWLLDAVHRVADGVPPLDAARQAHDAAAGRPRRKRPPAEAAWLEEEITAVLDTIWAALRDQDSFGRPLPLLTARSPAREGR